MPDIDPVAGVGVDDNQAVPGLAEEATPVIPELSNQGIQSTANEMASSDEDMDIDSAFVKMVVVHGIVMGPSVCVFTRFIYIITNCYLALCL